MITILSRSTLAEGRRPMRPRRILILMTIDQLVAQGVVSSFIHLNQHREQNSLVPAVAISGLDGHIMVVMYDCKLDVLLVSIEIREELSQLCSCGCCFTTGSSSKK